MRRAISLAFLVAGVVGCTTFNSDLSPDELHQLSLREKTLIQFTGQKDPPPQYSEKVGKVEGRVCQAALLSSITEFEAMVAMWTNAMAKKATAVIDAECSSSNVLVATGGSYCWPGYYCQGTGVK